MFQPKTFGRDVRSNARTGNVLSGASRSIDRHVNPMPIHFDMRTRTTAFFLILCFSLLLAACAGFMGPREVDLPLYRLQEALNRKFPFNNRYLDLLDIHIANPQLSLQPGTNRLSVMLDADASPPFLGQSWKGRFALSGALRYDSGRNAIMLADPRVENVAFDGVDPTYNRQLAKVGSLIAEQLLKDTPLYTFRPEDLRYGGTSFIPTQIVAKASGLVVTFEPAR
jgi:hypothetical protein